jgi:hypothetical protein
MYTVFKRNAVTEPWKYAMTITTEGLAESNAVNLVKIGNCVMARVFEFKNARSIPDTLPPDIEERMVAHVEKHGEPKW